MTSESVGEMGESIFTIFNMGLDILHKGRHQLIQQWGGWINSVNLMNVRPIC